jgi:hypothetical protein
MPNDNISFTITIPVRELDAETVINAFLQLHPYNNEYVPVVEDYAGNLIENPITPSMYVEDCIAYYVMEVTKSYLVNNASATATELAKQQASQQTDSLKSWIDSL